MIQITTYHSCYDSLAVYSFTRIHPVKISMPLRIEIELITQSIIIHFLAFCFVHNRGRPPGLEYIHEITIPVQGVNQRKLCPFQVAIHLFGRSIQAVQYLKLNLLVRIIIIGHIQSGHEVVHVLYHVAVFVNVNRVDIKLNSSVSSALLAGKERKLIKFDTYTCIVNTGRNIVNITRSIITTIKTLPITIAQPIVDITLHFDAELFHLECPLIETGLIPFHIEVTMHVEIEIELIGFLFYTGHLFKEAFIVRHEITF